MKKKNQAYYIINLDSETVRILKKGHPKSNRNCAIGQHEIVLKLLTPYLEDRSKDPH